MAVHEAGGNAFDQRNFKGENTAAGSIIYKDNGDDSDHSDASDDLVAEELIAH